MAKVVGIEFKSKGKIYYFDLNNVELNDETEVIVETEKGLEYGNIVIFNENIKSGPENIELSKVIRVATKSDKKIYEKNKKDSEKAIENATRIAKDLGLSMTFVDSNFSFERNQLMLYFISDNRVDFRDLARQLAGIYKTRIELRQIGVRDKAKEVSGLGQCGRKLCCSSFLKDLDSVTIAMAKNQNIVLNPNKINGQCGRLLCCFNYEDELYRENRKYMPELGERVDTDFGEGTVIFIDIPNKKFIVNIPDHGKEIIKIKNKCEECEKCNK